MVIRYARLPPPVCIRLGGEAKAADGEIEDRQPDDGGSRCAWSGFGGDRPAVGYGDRAARWRRFALFLGGFDGDRPTVRLKTRQFDGGSFAVLRRGQGQLTARSRVGRSGDDSLRRLRSGERWSAAVCGGAEDGGGIEISAFVALADPW